MEAKFNHSDSKFVITSYGIVIVLELSFNKIIKIHNSWYFYEQKVAINIWNFIALPDEKFLVKRLQFFKTLLMWERSFHIW